MVLLLPAGPALTTSMRFAAFAGVLMALLWLTEAMPMGLTALIPLIAFPLAGITSAEKLSASYGNTTVFLFLGGFLVSATFERWGLHQRIAFFTLRHVGTEPRRIVFAVLLVTAFLSMWISNTATTLMMTPIAVAIVRGLGTADEGGNAGRVARATLLGVAYGASLGGVGTPIGTPTNLIFFGAARELFPNERTITFAEWMVFGLAYLLLAVPICWLILILTSRVQAGERVPLDSLGLTHPGAMSRAEKTAITLCASTALLWIFRADLVLGSVTIPGWSSLFSNPKAINDTTVAVTMAALAFLIPAGGGKRLLDWAEFRRVPWDVLILFGGGFALADALESTGFSRWVGARLSFIGSWPPALMVAALCIVVTLLSEVASNVATATAMMPIAAAVAVSIGVHPYLLMIPAVMAASRVHAARGHRAQHNRLQHRLHPHQGNDPRRHLARSRRYSHHHPADDDAAAARARNRLSALSRQRAGENSCHPEPAQRGEGSRASCVCARSFAVFAAQDDIVAVALNVISRHIGCAPFSGLQAYGALSSGSQHTMLPGYVHDHRDGTVEVLARVRRADLAAEASLPLRDDRKTEAAHVYAILQKLA